MTSIISELKCGDVTLTLREESDGKYAVTREITCGEETEMSVHEPSDLLVLSKNFDRLEQAAVAFAQCVVSLMTVYAEAPCAAAEEAFKKKVFA